MPDGNLLLTLRQINICLGLYESEKLAASEMTFAQAFLLNEIFSMDSSCVCSTELCERMGGSAARGWALPGRLFPER